MVKPRSVNSSTRGAKKATYYAQLQAAYRAAAGRLQSQSGKTLYGIVYYLKQEPNNLDSDNLSKPVWDALRSLAYQDDSEIVLRVAGVVDMRATAITDLPLTIMPDNVADDLIAHAGEPHILYIELGESALKMFPFGLSRLKGS